MYLIFDNDRRDSLKVADMKHALATFKVNNDWDRQVVLFGDDRKPIKRWIRNLFERPVETAVDATPEQDRELIWGSDNGFIHP